ncbi:MAG: hypothetical protein IPF63_03450 [Bacteroidetes bacterium]|nr:hypothetical protein [Bacteroidota bacterium]
MKQLILIAILILSTKLIAQETNEISTSSNKYNHHFNIGYSWNRFNPLLLGLMGINNGMYDYNSDSYFYPYKENGKYNFIKQKNINSFVFGYSKSSKRYQKATFGITGTFDLYKEFYTYSLEGNTINTTQTTQAYSVMANAYYHYLKKSKWVDLYFGGDFGMMLIRVKTKDTDNNISESKTKGIPMGSFCPFGIQLKTRVAPYLQMNIGSRGMIEGGIVANF